jgi:NADH-quinone oxidoreductase subunit J
VAAVGAVVLTHRTRLTARRGQKELSIDRFKAEVPPTPPAAPGVYASGNAADMPAIDAGGDAIATSVPESIRVRGQVHRLDPKLLAPGISPGPQEEPEPAPAPGREPGPELESTSDAGPETSAEPGPAPEPDPASESGAEPKGGEA